MSWLTWDTIILRTQRRALRAATLYGTQELFYKLEIRNIQIDVGPFLKQTL